MTTVIVNGAPWQGPLSITVAQVVDVWCPSPKGVAVALNGEVIPASRWSVTAMADGDHVEIVTATAGG
jgi:sulfur carrier protein